MQFTLVYDGQLSSASNNSRRNQKHAIRKAIHKQLVQLIAIRRTFKDRHRIKMRRVRLAGFQFLPLLRKDQYVSCCLQVIFLRPGIPGQLIVSGDLDNRLKTLFDALRVPHHLNELPNGASPEPSERPFWCLLEDDSLITRQDVTAERLLLPADNENEVRLIITVRLEAIVKGAANLAF